MRMWRESGPYLASPARRADLTGCYGRIFTRPDRRAGEATENLFIAFIDDATWVVPHAAYTFSAGAVTYLSVLEQAVRRRGIPRRLHVDDGAAVRPRQLAVVCAKLGIALIHARPYKPPRGQG